MGDQITMYGIKKSIELLLILLSVCVNFLSIVLTIMLFIKFYNV